MYHNVILYTYNNEILTISFIYPSWITQQDSWEDVEEEKKDVEKPAEIPKAKPKPKKALAERIEEREVGFDCLSCNAIFFISYIISLMHIYICKNSEEGKGGGWKESERKGRGTYTRRKAGWSIKASEVARGGGLTAGDGNFRFVDSSRL